MDFFFFLSSNRESLESHFPDGIQFFTPILYYPHSDLIVKRTQTLSSGNGRETPIVSVLSSILGNDCWPLKGFSPWKPRCSNSMSHRCKSKATNANISGMAKYRPGQYVRPPPNGLWLGIEARSGALRKRWESNVW